MNMRNLRVPDVPVVPIVFVALVAGLLVAAATPVAALPMSQEPRAPSRADRDIQGLMDAYIISKMEEALELDDEQFAKMVLAQRKLQQHRRDYQRKRRESLRELQRLVRAADSEDEKIVALVGQLDTMKADLETTLREDYRTIDEILSARQRGRYRLLEVMLERRLQELMREVRGRTRNPDRRP